jgi:hypothetical protein
MHEVGIGGERSVLGLLALLAVAGDGFDDARRVPVGRLPILSFDSLVIEKINGK